jgi:RNA polymerase sigma-54 factor
MGTIFMEMRQRGQMTLTPRLQQSVRLLQLSSLELPRSVQQALAIRSSGGPRTSDNEIDGLHPAGPDTAVAAGERHPAGGTRR